MTQFHKTSLFLLRVGLGWLMLYAGWTHLTSANFAVSAAGYMGGAKILTGFYGWLASPGMLPFVSNLNAWALTLLGVSLILGALVRVSSWLGALLMLLYYLPLGFPYPDAHSYIVDDHIIYILILLVLAAYGAGRVWGLDSWIKKKFPRWSWI